MGIFLDLIVLAIIFLTIFISAKRGFVKVLIELVGFVLAIYITFTFSTPLANITYDKIIEPTILKSINSVTDSTSENVINKSWEAIPNVIKNNAEKFGISKESFDQNINDNISSGAHTAVENASQNVIKPVIVKPIGAIYAFFMMAILIVIVKFLAKAINKLFSFSIVGKLNRTLGGILGIPKGIILVVIFCFIVSFIVSVSNNGFLIFTNDAIESSYIFKFVNGFYPFK